MRLTGHTVYLAPTYNAPGLRDHGVHEGLYGTGTGDWGDGWATAARAGYFLMTSSNALRW